MAIPFTAMFGFGFGGTFTDWLLALAAGGCLSISLTLLLFANRHA